MRTFSWGRVNPMWSLHHDIIGNVAIAKTARGASNMPLRGVKEVPRGGWCNAPRRLGKYGRHHGGFWPTGDGLLVSCRALVCECFGPPNVRG